MRHWFSIWCFLLITVVGIGQDLHFSQFLYSPLTLNPALTGNFDGRYRIGLNHREQWRAISQPFQTTGLWADSYDFLNVKGFNAGIDLYYDQAGTGEYNTFSVSIPLALRIFRSKDSVHSVYGGLQTAYEQQSINTDKLTTDSQWNGTRFDPNQSRNESFSGVLTNHMLNFAAGLNYKFKKGRWDIFAGTAIYNLTQPKINWLGGSGSILPYRMNFHAGGRIDLNTKWFLTPGILYSRQGKFEELVYGTEFNYALNPAPYKYRVLFLGTWNRGKDAGITSLGMYYNSWRFGLSYDINYSDLNTASNYRGGWEISIIYILRELLPKRVNYKYCPDFI